ncbi:MAG: carboxypeptidase-like regulatory domain-containing protein [Mariniphaga sp.]|nr:carboxypeptidase-like regulatory domain-containing protein [Mariniphaga sp.]
MRKITFTILSILTGILLNAQESNVIQVINGKVIDETNSPVSYTNIGLEGTYYGTASDAEGNFELKVPAELADRQIFFSAVGYKNRTFPLSDFFEKEFKLIRLESQSYDIENIDINAQSMVLYRILRTATENIPRNFANGPFNMGCTYEFEKIKEDENFSLKAQARIYDRTGYGILSVENAYKERKYSFSNVEKNYGSYLLSEGLTNLDEILELDLARSVATILNPVILSQFVLNQEDDTKLNGTDVWVIGFNLAEPGLKGSGDYYASRFEGKIYINKNNYEIKKIEGWIRSEKQSRAGRGLAIGVNSDNYLENVVYDFTTSYNTEGLEFISLHKNYKQNGIQINESSRLVVLDINSSSVIPISSRDYYIGE